MEGNGRERQPRPAARPSSSGRRALRSVDGAAAAPRPAVHTGHARGRPFPQGGQWGLVQAHGVRKEQSEARAPWEVTGTSMQAVPVASWPFSRKLTSGVHSTPETQRRERSQAAPQGHGHRTDVSGCQASPARRVLTPRGTLGQVGQWLVAFLEALVV